MHVECVVIWNGRVAGWLCVGGCFGFWVVVLRFADVAFIGCVGELDEPESLILAQSERWRHA